jgi:ankyrin repeat protein
MGDIQGATHLHLVVLKKLKKNLPLEALLAEPDLLTRLAAVDSKGVGVLAYAVRKDNALACKLLVVAGADVNACDNDGSSALTEAARQGSIESVRYLLTVEGILVDPGNVPVMSPLGCAALNGNVAICRLLVDAGANVNFKGTVWSPHLYGEPLCMAARKPGKGNEQVVQYLVGVAGVDVNCPPTNNRPPRAETNPLCLAVIAGSVGTCRILIAAGADVNLMPNYRHKPIYLAVKYHHPRVLELLLDVPGGVIMNQSSESLFFHCLNRTSNWRNGCSQIKNHGNREDAAECTALLLNHPQMEQSYKKDFVRQCLANFENDKRGLLLSGNGCVDLRSCGLTTSHIKRVIRAIQEGDYCAGLDLRGNPALLTNAAILVLAPLLQNVIQDSEGFMSLKPALAYPGPQALLTQRQNARTRVTSTYMRLTKANFHGQTDLPPDQLAHIAAISFPDYLVAPGPFLYKRARAFVLRML